MSSAMDSGSRAPSVSATSEVINDGMNDIARTVHQEKMRVQANGRRTFQQVYLWMPENKNTVGKPKYDRGSTTQQYQPSVDGPSRTPCPILPRDQELVDHADAKLYLEVGVIIGADPTKYEVKGFKNKQRDLDRQRRGILPRDPGAMRVFTPVTEYIAPQAKFYVGCRLSGGRLHPRVINFDAIFFYAEFWSGISDSLNLKLRTAELATACKRAAAVNKSIPGGLAAAATPSSTPQTEAATPVSLRKSQGPISTAVRSAGSDAFFNFDEPLSAENARSLALDLMKANSNIGYLQYELIQSMHQVLCTGSSGPMGRDLGPNTLATLDFFIRDCQQRVPEADVNNDAVVRKAVRSSLTSVYFILQNPFWKHLLPPHE